MSVPPAGSLKRQGQLRAWIESEIAEGNFHPGDRLDENKLCEKFGVSRTPVREALLQLASLGLVVFRPRQGAEIARLSVKQIAAMLEVLAKLEGHCAQLSARRMVPEEHEALRSIVDSALPLIEAKDIAGYDEANRQFHEAIYVGARNEFLASQVRDIRRRLRVYRRNPFQRPGGMERSFQGHRLVADAVLIGDDIAAEAAMHDHVIGAVGLMDFLAELSDEPSQGVRTPNADNETPRVKSRTSVRIPTGSRTNSSRRKNVPGS